MLTSCSTRFSRSTSSTLRLRLRPVSTSLRYVYTQTILLHHHQLSPSIKVPRLIQFFFFFLSYRPLCLRPAPSSWTSSAPAASLSPPSSRTPRASSSALAARPSSASPPVARPGSLRAARSGESKRNALTKKNPLGLADGCAD